MTAKATEEMTTRDKYNDNSVDERMGGEHDKTEDVSMQRKSIQKTRTRREKVTNRGQHEQKKDEKQKEDVHDGEQDEGEKDKMERSEN